MKAHILSVIVLITAGGFLPLFGQNIDITITDDICGGDPDGAISLVVVDGADSLSDVKKYKFKQLLINYHYLLPTC